MPDFSQLIEYGHPLLQGLQQNHPNVATAVKLTAGTGLVVAGSSVLLPSLGLGTLNVIGFASAGPVAGSLATSIQSVVYAGATTGLFSICQSFVATAAAASGGAIVSSIGAVIAGASILFY